ncbi:hypothetical protein [Roseibacillus persicicus]|uniref:hypothetical protein n=1 Tax=Roseibacillus persicicus TaxID=454148 RepID=UPI001676BE7B|nr:hypothetical protein [Roseibacillus persicicus]
MLKPVGVIFLILSLFASAMGQQVHRCGFSGDCSPVASEDCSDCQHHHSDEVSPPANPSDEDDHPDDESGHPHDHHHGCQSASPSILPNSPVSLKVPDLYQSPFVFLQARPSDAPPYELEQPPRA